MYLYGASGHSKVVIDILRLLNFDIRGMLDDNPKTASIAGVRVFQASEIALDSQDRLVISIGDNATRKKIALKSNTGFLTAIHPSASVSEAASVKEGTVVMSQAVINAFASVGRHCIVNSGAVVEHDCVLADFVHVSPNAALAGGVIVGEGSHIGIGASVIQGVTIGKWVTVGAGTVILENVPDYAVIVGNPGRIIRFNQP